MTRLTIDPDLKARLGDLTGCLELCDQTGQVLGYFTPVADHSLYEGVEPPISEEELRQREQETEQYTTSEVLDHLGKLTLSGSDG